MRAQGRVRHSEGMARATNAKKKERILCSGRHDKAPLLWEHEKYTKKKKKKPRFLQNRGEDPAPFTEGTRTREGRKEQAKKVAGVGREGKRGEERIGVYCGISAEVQGVRSAQKKNQTPHPRNRGIKENAR